MGTMKEIALDDPEISNYVTDEAKEVLEEEIELLDGASAEFDQELVNAGELSPVFFGSALMNFGVENFLNYFLKMTSSPLPRTSDQGTIDPIEEKDFSAFVFKIQAIKHTPEILLEFSIRVFSPLEIPSQHHRRSLPMKESQPSHQNISQECVR